MYGLELRESRDGNSWTITGLASTYNRPYDVRDLRYGSYREVIRPGAFGSALAGEHDVALYVQHNHNLAPLAMTPSRRGLTLADTAMGLGLEASLPKDDPDNAAAVSKARRGILGGLSIGFTVPEGGDSRTGDEREVITTKLFEISLVATPANPGATVETVRTADGVELETRSVPILIRQDGVGSSGGPISSTIESEGDDGDVCPECGGSGKVDGGMRRCPNCNGVGKVSPEDQEDDDMDGRSKYSAAEKAAMLKQGHALANANGEPSFPIEDEADLRRAIRAVGRGSRSPERIRQHIMKRAAALGLMRLIPDSWAADGTVKRSAVPYAISMRRLDELDRELRKMPRYRVASVTEADLAELERMGREVAERRYLERAFMPQAGPWRAA
jgi:HK97 family phage prohead protease